METISYSKIRKSIKSHRCDFCNAIIDKNVNYYDGVFKYEGKVYHWRIHIHCSDIAEHLKMYDNVDEGLTSDDFWEFIQNEYLYIMSEHFNKEYESKDFKIPSLNERLLFVLKFHKIEISGN